MPRRQRFAPRSGRRRAAILKANNKIGVATAVSSNGRFRGEATRSAAIKSVARNIPIGKARPSLRPKVSEEQLRAFRRASRGTVAKGSSGAGYNSHNAAEPLADLQWDMRMIHATPTARTRRRRAASGCSSGIIDTGVDGNHPDIAPNFDRALSRNFTTDIPLVDGPCADEPDASCTDPNDVDENSHGTHVASTVASPINGIGMAGVAPNVTLVNLRAGQDSGFFFLQPSVDALTYAGDHGIDVVNMSYFIDPWLYNCGNPLHPVPEDSPPDSRRSRRRSSRRRSGRSTTRTCAASRSSPPRQRARRHQHPARSTDRARTSRRAPSTTAR